MQIELDENSLYNNFLQNFTQQTKLGEGTYGIVTKAFDRRRAKFVALKKIKLDNCDDEGVPSTTIREIAILSKLQHPNIISLLEVKYFLDEKKIYLVFDSMKYDLRKYLDKNTSITLNNLKPIIYQILLGLSYCHSRRVLHRDLKPQNILLNETMTVKLADFGLSRVFPFPMPKFTREIATPWYRAPELMLGDDNYGTGVDIWAVGCIMAECLNGFPLFQGDSQVDMLFKIMKLLGTPTDANYFGLSKLPNFMITFPKFRGEDLTQRIPKLENNQLALELLQSMLQLNPGKRPQAKELLRNQWFDDIRNNY
ncbi:unnamed protein product [Paramecium pentaurelia]|uniref:Cyclin-dependent kinase 2 homolog n=1 Tax=Paramecium pentaurelia TaxID=43138 RepID=A0A8S1T754_9CILI|nr:unnamed protein product [Paramecium pentaurelia]